MDSRIQKILDDIYRVAPELKEREPEISEIVSGMLGKVPNLKIDRDFVEKLRQNLGADIQNPIEDLVGDDKFQKNIFDFKKVMTVFFFVIAVVIFIFIIAIFGDRFLRNGDSFEDVTLLSRPSIVVLGDKAFGTLDGFADQTSSGDTGENAVSSKMATPSGAGIGGGGNATDGTNSEIYPPYIPVQYVYVYKGEVFTQDQVKMNVLRRVTDKNWGDGLGQVVRGMDFSVFDMSSFGDLNITNLNVGEDKDFGYQISVDFVRGTISVYKDWQKWPNYFEDCKDDDCYNRLRIKLSDVPDNQTIIGKTNEFLSTHRIDTSVYGDPQIDRESYVYVQDGVSYVSDDLSVVYPLKINDMEVYESFGGAHGLMVSYDLRSERVSSVNNLMTQSYQSSSYDVESDVNNIIMAAESTDKTIYAENAEVGEKIEVALGTPTLAYAKYWQYKDSEELEYLVPAFVFPIEGGVNGLYRKNIVVPLVKEFMDQYYGPILMKSAVE